MSKPTVGDRKKLKRLTRYLVGRPRVVSQFKNQRRQEGMDGYSDSDWAGCRRTAKSTSGGVVMLGGHCLKSWSSTQKSITLSSGESELVAAVKMCTELVGLAQLAYDWGIDLGCRVHVDSSAALGVAHRRGNGKLRHAKVGLLWIQEKVDEEEISMVKVRGEDNPADMMTKNLNSRKIDQFTAAIGQMVREGRAEASCELG